MPLEAPQQPSQREMMPAGLTQPDKGDMTITDAEYPVLGVHAQTALALQFVTESTIDMSAWDLPRITVPSGGGTVWTYYTAEGPTSSEHLSGILVYYKEGRDFWPVVYGDGESVPPACTSIDGKIGMGDPGGNCYSCHWNQWGSRVEIDPRNPQSNAKACRQTARLFLLQPGSNLPTLIIAPPTSIKPIRRYVMQLAGMGYIFFGVETHLYLQEATAGGYKVAQIAPVKGRTLNQEQLQKSFGMRESFRGMFEAIRPTMDEAGVS